VSEVRLSAQPRTAFGKGGARRTRREGLIPAVIYGHGEEPRHISLPSREFAQAIKKGGANVLLTLSVDGEDVLTIPKAIQRHPIQGIFEHVDLLSVRSGEKVTIDVPLTITGEIARGALLEQELTTVSLEAEATHLPTEVEVNIEGLEIGTVLTAGELTLPKGASLITTADSIVLILTEAKAAKTESDADGSSEAAAVAAE
jgi:large subunit ribosomal protein L25